MEQGNKVKLEGRVQVAILAYFQIPKSTSNKAKKAMESTEIRPTKKPDADNIIKIILDSLNKLAYDDDSQVVSVRLEKFYSNEPRVEVAISNF
jgi:Holliday junction resolvase RusA-like endonuclease